MEFPETWDGMNASQQLDALRDDLTRRDRVLGEMVKQLYNALAGTEGASRRALLDAELALRAAQAADDMSTAAERSAKSLTMATWALVLVTAVLVLVTLVE